jgi:hypothetical protein
MDLMDPEDPTDLEDEGNAPPEPSHDDALADEIGEEFEPGGFERWRRESAVGSVGTGIARGLQNVFAPPPNQPVIVASVPGDPPDPERLQVILDPDDPTKSVAHLPPARQAGDDGEPA